ASVQLFCPLRTLKVCSGAFQVLLAQHPPHVLIVIRKLHHLLIAGQAVAWCFRVSFFVQMAKLVYPHQVKSVAQLPAGWVGAVMGISEFPVIIYHQPAGGRAWDIRVAVFPYRLIDVSQKSLNSLMYAVRPAKRPNHSWLFPRIALPLRL